jgi:hypothetical protein
MGKQAIFVVTLASDWNGRACRECCIVCGSSTPGNFHPAADSHRPTATHRHSSATHRHSSAAHRHAGAAHQRTGAY